jgi:hypothetical protein
VADPFTGDQLAAIFPEFLSLPNLNTTVSAALNFVAPDIVQATFGTDYVRALQLYAAHWLVMTGPQRGGGKGNVLGERVGDLSRQYQAGPTMATLDTTTYGQMLRRLMKRKVGSLIFVGQKYPANAGNFPPGP